MSALTQFLGGGGLIVRRELFTASGTWTKSDDLVGDQVFITAIGGGGGGGGGSFGAGGGGGFFTVNFPVDVSGVSSEVVTIGSGGSGGSSGATTSFSSTLSLSGGGPGFTDVRGGLGGTSGGGRGLIGGGSGGGYGAADAGGGGGGGKVLDASEISGASGNGNGGGGGYGYGSGGGGSGYSSGGAGAPGAVLVEWLEKV